MRYPSGFLDEIRNRVPLSQVVSQKVRLKKSGRSFQGLCPFHQEKTPSFNVDDQRGTFKCFSCDEQGDVFAFVMKSRGLGFTEAVEELASVAGIALPKADPESVRREAHKLSLIEVNQYAVDFFRRSLARCSKEHPANEWLRSRALDDEQREAFAIGYAPGDGEGSLKEALARDGIALSSAVEAGLVVAGDDIPVARDRFRSRVIFPIFDTKGRPIAFGGRALDDHLAKYINSPETPVFDKGRTLYNAHKARQPAWDEAPLVVVEGYTATTSSVRAGFPATVAPMGTALTESHLESLWRMSDEPIICFDGDSAGTKAKRRAIDLAVPMLLPGRSLRFAELPSGLDPDDMVRSRGVAAYDQAVHAARSLVDTLWRFETNSRTTDTPERRTELEADLLGLVEKIPDRSLRRAYEDDLKDRIRALPRRTKVYRSNGVSNHSTSPAATRLAHGYASGMSLRDAMVVVACVSAPHAAMDAVERLRGLSSEARAAVGGIVDLIAATDPDSEPLALCEAVRASGIGPQYDWALQSLHDAGIVSLDPGAGSKAAETLLRGD